MIGRLEYLPGVWAYLHYPGLVWASDGLDPEVLTALNHVFGPDCNETIDPMSGFGQLRRAAEVLGGRVEYLATPPELPEGAVP